MNKSVLIVHGFGPKEDDFQLISTLQTLGYTVEYFDWFNWNSEFNIEDFNTNIKSYLDENNPKLVIGKVIKDNTTTIL